MAVVLLNFEKRWSIKYYKIIKLMELGKMNLFKFGSKGSLWSKVN